MNMRIALSKFRLRSVALGFVIATFGGVLAPVAVGAHSVPTYVALGDSVAAGYGAGAIATSPNATPCGRTVAAYPTLAATALGQTSYNLACAGATTANGLITDQTRNGVTVPSQIKQLYKLRVRPTYVTVTIGANDVRWNDYLAMCLQPNTTASPGCDTAQNTADFTALLDVATPQIYAALAAINLTDAKKVAVTGYYDPFGATAPLFGLSAGEITWYRDRVAQLNTRLQQIAAWAHDSYVDVTSLNAATGDIILGDPLTTYAFAHPTALGQQKIANLVQTAYNN
jgi:lysophospholipase L1-like esterase